MTIEKFVVRFVSYHTYIDISNKNTKCYDNQPNFKWQKWVACKFVPDLTIFFTLVSFLYTLFYFLTNN